jgi:hypothetical protein
VVTDGFFFGVNGMMKRSKDIISFVKKAGSQLYGYFSDIPFASYLFKYLSSPVCVINLQVK